MPDALQGQEVAAPLLLLGLLLGACSGPSASPEPPTVELSGSAAMLQPVPATPRPPLPPQDAAPLRWLDDPDEARAIAKRQGRLLLLFATAEWAIPARQMEREVWPQPQVGSLLAGMVLLRLDLTNTSTASQERADRLGVRVVPTVMVVRSDGEQTKAEGMLSGAGLADFLRTSRKKLEPR